MTARIISFPSRRTSALTEYPRPAAPEATATPEIRVLARGVWFAPYLVGGHRVFCAVTSSGNRLAEVVEGEDMDVDAVHDALFQLLSVADPVTARAGLALVSGGAE